MNIEQFSALTEAEQGHLIKNNGTYLAKRHALNFCVLLFQLESFYLEVYYDRNNQEVSRIKCFDSVDLLEPYLERIDISQLMN